MAIDNLPNGIDESRLSGAYIRSLVKQLSTTSKPCLNTTQNMNINNNDTLSIVPHYNYNNNNNNPTTPTTTKKLAMAKPTRNQHDPTQGGHKKQVRRRFHTSRPYQERLLNMAEARKEIVTALKFHRAAMKQANERNQHHHHHQQHHQQHNNNINERHVNNYDVSSHKVKSEPLSEDNSCYYYSSYNRNHNDQNYYPLPSNNIISTPSSLFGPTPFYESLSNIALPHQTLGLNLNLQAFTNLDVNFCHNNNINSTTTTTNNPSSTAASPSPPLTPRDLTAAEAVEGVGPTNNMHPSLDEDEIAKMRSIGEQYQTEWDDSLNLMKSAWWFRFLKMVDFGKDIKGCYYDNYNNENDHDILFEEEFMEFPPWLGASNDDSFLHQQLDDSCSEDNTTLPWMDIEDIDGMDDEWLS